MLPDVIFLQALFCHPYNACEFDLPLDNGLRELVWLFLLAFLQFNISGNTATKSFYFLAAKVAVAYVILRPNLSFDYFKLLQLHICLLAYRMQ